MILAAIDSRSAYPALVVVDQDDCRVLWAGSIVLGELRLLGKKLPNGKDATRVITESDIDRAVSLLVETAHEFGATRIVVTSPVGRAHEATFVEACKACGVEEIAVKLISKITADYCQKYLKDWPSSSGEEGMWHTGDSGGTRRAAFVALTAMGVAESPAKGESPKKLRSHGETVPSATFAGRVTEGDAAAPNEPVEAPPPVPVSTTPRTMGIDTGRCVGLTIAEPMAGGNWFQVFKMTVVVDFSSEDGRHDFLIGVMDRICQYNVQRVIIERVSHVHGGWTGEENAGALGAVRAMAGQLVGANWLGGMIEGACWAAAHPLETNTASASHWRRKLCGGKSTVGDDKVQDIVRARFPLWPVESTEHERDAAGIILWDDLTEAPPPPKAERAPRKGKRGRNEACTCALHKGPHYRGCPAIVPRKSKQTCAVCGEPRRGHECKGPPEAPSEDE